MVYRFKFLFFAVLFSISSMQSIVSADEPQPAAQKDSKKPFMVRVLLDEQPIASAQGWTLKTKNGFWLTDINDSTKKIALDTDTLELKVRDGLLYVNNKRLTKKNFAIHPCQQGVTYNDNWYEGHFLVITHNNKIHLINTIGLEDYVLAVLCAESWPGWPLEVDKGLAIACRSYAIFRILEAQEQERVYHIKSTNSHQTYRGVPTSRHAHLKTAVDETAHIFLAHNKKPILAMFDSCCGGVIPAKVKGSLDFKKVPYLARTYPCDFCKRCKLFTWSVTYEREFLEETFKKAAPKIKRVKDVVVAKKDPAGLVREVSVKCSNGYHALPGKKVYSLLKDGVKSFCYSVTKKSEKITFDGRGYGHHMGLCQWGSREMVRDGWDHKDILQFYYPGTVLMKLV